MTTGKGPQPPVFRHPINISPDAIDAMGHVNNAVYLHWVQEAVLEYWHHASPPQIQGELLWVALKHEITYRLPLFLSDGVEAHVMATGTHGSRASFATLFKRGDEIAAEVRSSWCCVDAITRRPRRIPDHIAKAFLPISDKRGRPAL